MRQRILAAALLLAVLVPVQGYAAAKTRAKAPKGKAKTEVKKDTTKKESKYDTFFKKEKKSAKGLFTVHLKEGKVYFEMPEALFGRAFIMGSTIKSISDDGVGLVGSKNGLKTFTFVRVDTATVQLREAVAGFTGGSGDIVKDLSKLRTGAVIKQFPVKARSNDSTAYAFDVTDFFLSGDEELGPNMKNSGYSGNTVKLSFQKNLSYVSDVKAFEDNVSVTSTLSYTFTVNHWFTGKVLKKSAPLTAEMVRSILLLPEEIYHPRTADPRIGYFFTRRERMGDQVTTSTPVYLVNRWRLEPSDTAAYRRGEKVTPVKPIVFYIDTDFPEWWKPYIREAVTAWNKPFERIGFKDAVIARDFPADDPSFDPDNIRYNCIRYAPVGIQNAMGPSWVDPRSGEILNASVYVYHDVIKLLTNWIFVQTAQADPAVRTPKMDRAVLGDALRYVIRHEVGHTLGLMHNMSASYVIPVEKLRDPDYSQRYGTTTSIMDYARFNYVAQPGDKERGVRLTPPEFGVYDYWAIRWGYTPVFDTPDFEKETAITARWITDSTAADPVYIYGKQQMYSQGFDPRCQTEDLSDDVLKATEYGISNLKYIMAHFMDWVDDKDDPDYLFRLGIYEGIASQYMRYAGHVLMNIGGIYKNEIVPGDGRTRFANVPRERQKACMDLLLKMFRDTEWLSDKNVTGRLPLIGSLEYGVKSRIAGNLAFSAFLAGFSDGIATEEYSYSECLQAYYDEVWKPTKQGRRLTQMERRIQKDYITELMRSAQFKTPASSKSLTEEEEHGHPDHDLHSACQCGMCTLMKEEVGGFEWQPRMAANVNKLTQSAIYGMLMQAYDLMKARKGGASAEDKAHYELLMANIEYSLK